MELQRGIEPFRVSLGEVYRVRAIDVNRALDNFDAMIASYGGGLLTKA